MGQTQRRQAAAPQQQKAEKPATTAVATRVNYNAPVAVTTLRDILAKMTPQLRQALPSTVRLDPERFARMLLTTVSRTPHLQRCTARSILEAAMESAALGLAIEPSLGHAYMLPFGNEAKLLVGYRGYIALAHRSGRVAAVWAGVVHARDKWQRFEGTDPVIVHEPAPPRKVDQAGGAQATLEEEAIAYYACIKLLDGTVKSEWLWREDVEKVRKRSPAVKAGRSTPWDTDYDEMAKKTAIRRLCKTADLSPELTRAATVDEQRELGVEVEGVALADYELPAGAAAAATDARRSQLSEKYTGGAAGEPEGRELSPEEQAALDRQDAAEGREPGADG